MKTIAELYDQKTHLVKCCTDITERAKKESRSMTDEEQAAFDGHQEELGKTNRQIESAEGTERRNALAEKQAEELRTIREVEVKTAVNTGVVSETRDAPVVEFPEALKKYSKLKAFKGKNADRDAYRSGMWLRSEIFGDMKAKRWCQMNGIETRALSIAVNSAGGALVPEEFSAALINLREEYGVFRQNAMIMPMGRDVMVVPRQATTLTAAFAGENAAIGEVESTWNNVELTAKKMGVLTRMSTEIAEDAIINIADLVVSDFAYAFALLEDTVGFNGAGTAAHGGITGLVTLIEANTALAGYVDATAANDSHLLLDLADFNTLMGALPAYARGNAKWYVSSFGWDVGMNRLSSAAGGNLIQTIEGGFGRSFLGHPVVTTETMAGSGTQNNVALVLFGDLSAASILGDRRNISVGVSDQRYFDQDQIGLKATSRMDIANHGIGDATNAGPIVALIGQS